MKIVILGLSRFGLQVAGMMRTAGHQLALIDRDPDAFTRLPPAFVSTRILGIGIDQDVMRKAGIEQAELFIACTDSDNTNLMAAQVAKVVFNIKRSIARVHDEDRADIFNAMGLVEVICPTQDAARALSNTVAKSGA